MTLRSFPTNTALVPNLSLALLPKSLHCPHNFYSLRQSLSTDVFQNRHLKEKSDCAIPRLKSIQQFDGMRAVFRLFKVMELFLQIKSWQEIQLIDKSRAALFEAGIGVTGLAM